jgi:cobalt-zinc-cadmium efflux system membrane fusion protein
MTRRNNIIVFLVVLAVLGVGGYMLYGKLHVAPPADKPPPPGPTQSSRTELRYPAGAPQLDYLRSEPARAYPEPLIEPLNGRVAYDESFTTRIGSPIAGRVLAIGAEPGDRVTAGQTLLTLDAPEFAQASADVARAEAEARQQRAQFDRAKLLFDGEVMSRREFEAAEASRAQAEADLTRARSRLGNLTRGGASKGGQFRIASPMNGVITERKVNPGNEVRPDLADPLFVVTDPTRVWVIIELPERLLGKVAKGQDVIVEADPFPNQALPGTIAQVGDVVDPATRRVLVRCVVANPQRLLRPEMFVKVTPIPDEHAKFVRVPNSALITQGLQSYVFIEREPGVFVKRQVRLGLQARDFTFIHEGIAEGEPVVVSGVLRLNSELSTAN